MIHYVNGFLFDEKCAWVVLLKKNRPDWQAGFLNGVGGKAEESEYFIDAMARESFEEIGVVPEWQYFISMKTTTWAVHFFAAKDQQRFDLAEQRTDEEVVRSLVQNIQTTNTLPCLRFLVPMAAYILTMKFSDPEKLCIGMHDARA